jgi:hypothetical protein
MMISGYTTFVKVEKTNAFTGQRLAVFQAYCQMYDSYDWAKKGVTNHELIDFIKTASPKVESQFKNLEHINKYLSRLKRAGVIEEGPSRVCRVRGGTRLVKTHRITRLLPKEVPQPKTTAAQLKEIQEQIRYMDTMYNFEDHNVKADFVLLKQLAGVE